MIQVGQKLWCPGCPGTIDSIDTISVYHYTTTISPCFFKSQNNLAIPNQGTTLCTFLRGADSIHWNSLGRIAGRFKQGEMLRWLISTRRDPDVACSTAMASDGVFTQESIHIPNVDDISQSQPHCRNGSFYRTSNFRRAEMPKNLNPKRCCWRHRSMERFSKVFKGIPSWMVYLCLHGKSRHQINPADCLHRIL